MPPTASLKNPVDVIGDAKDDRYRSALDAVCSDEGVDQTVVVVTPQMMTNVLEIADVIGEARSMCNKPIIACPMGLVDVGPAVDYLHKIGVPTYAFPENAMRSLAAKARFAEWTRTPLSEYKQYDVNKQAAAKIMDEELKAGRPNLIEVKALDVFKHYNFPITPFKLATSPDEAAAAAKEMGFPVVLKIVGPTILHKTDVGGVVAQRRGREIGARRAHRDDRPRA